jgi:tripartite-type tricarboxylate transporter receptor subunit TctC
MSSAMVGGHLTLGICGADEVKGLMQAGDIIPLVSMSPKRLSEYPNIPSTVQDFHINSTVGTWRALYCRTATPQAAVDAMYAAITKAWHMPEYQTFLKNACYLDRPGLENAADTMKLENEEYGIFTDYLKQAGIIK